MYKALGRVGNGREGVGEDNMVRERGWREEYNPSILPQIVFPELFNFFVKSAISLQTQCQSYYSYDKYFHFWFLWEKGNKIFQGSA